MAKLNSPSASLTEVESTTTNSTTVNAVNINAQNISGSGSISTSGNIEANNIISLADTYLGGLANIYDGYGEIQTTIGRDITTLDGDITANNVTAVGYVYGTNLYGDNLSTDESIQTFGTLVAWGNTTLGANTQILGTLTANQIAFPATQVSSTDPNTLDDYEEGTFTPGFSFGGGTTGIGYSSRQGTYVKIGRFVFVTIDLTLSNNGSSSGNWFIEGLPIPDETMTNFNGSLYISFYSGVALPGTDRSLQCTIQQNGDGRGIFRAGGSGGSFTLNDTHTTNTTRVIMAGGYRSAD